MRNMVKAGVGKVAVIVAVLVTLIAFAPRAEALVANGGTIAYEGSGDITITFIESLADFRSFLYLFDGSFTPRTDTGGIAAHGTFPAGAFFNSDSTPAGTTFTLTAAYLAAHGYVTGSEMIFGIMVNENCDSAGVCSDDTFEDTWFMGGAGRNADAIIHDNLTSGGPDLAIVGFEDHFGGFDLDYNDHIFSFFPVTSRVPNPGGLVLVGVGLIGFALADWKRRRR
jgi:hypothetical protein